MVVINSVMTVLAFAPDKVAPVATNNAGTFGEFALGVSIAVFTMAVALFSAMQIPPNDERRNEYETTNNE